VWALRSGRNRQGDQKQNENHQSRRALHHSSVRLGAAQCRARKRVAQPHDSSSIHHLTLGTSSVVWWEREKQTRLWPRGEVAHGLAGTEGAVSQPVRLRKRCREALECSHGDGQGAG
jgi:hypothetical protein